MYGVGTEKNIFGDMQQLLKFIPNLLTLLNLTMGIFAVLFIAQERMVSAALCVAAALVLDFLDGFAARILKAHSEIGKQLDSLADMVSFGVVPGLVLFHMISITQGHYFTDIADRPMADLLAASVAALVPMGAAMRLAKFNLHAGNENHFIGLPTPAMTMIVMCIPVVLEMNYHLNFYNPFSDALLSILAEKRKWEPSDVLIVKMLFSEAFYILLSILLTALMVSKLPMISLKFKGVSWQMNKWKYAILIWAALAYLIFLIPYLPLPFSYGLIDYLIAPIIMIGYVILSLIYATFGLSKESTK